MTKEKDRRSREFFGTVREVYAVLRVRKASEARTEAKLPFLRIKGNLLMVGKRSPKPSMRVRLLLPLYERKALAFLFLMGNCESLGGFFLHRAIVLPIKPDFTLRAYLMSEDTRKSAMKNKNAIIMIVF